MMSRLVCLLTSLSLSVGVTTADDVSVAGIRVTGDGYGKTQFGAELRPFSWTSGTSIALLISRPEGGLIDFSDDKSKVATVVDDTGNRLDEGESKFGQPPARFAMGTVSKDGKAGMIELTTLGRPAADAKSITASGTLVLVTGTSQETRKSKPFKLAKGTKVEVGDLSFEITTTGKPRFGRGEAAISLRTKQSIDTVAEWELLKTDGTAVESRAGATMRMGFAGNTTTDKELILDQQLEEGILLLKVWTDRKEVEVPIDLTVAVGF